MDTNGEVSYHICLDPYDTINTVTQEDETPHVGSFTGFVLPCNFYATGFNAQFDVKDENDFNSEDAKTAEQIMKTFNSL